MAVIVLAFLMFILGGSSYPCSYLKECIKEIKRKDIKSSDVWLYLLHYENGRSHIDHSYFFISKRGREDPYSELLETIKELFKGTPVKCRFPARVYYLKGMLGIRIDLGECDNFKYFLNKLKGNKIYLVYANQYPRSLSSLFGHLFLKIGSEKSGYYMVSYTADTTVGKGLLYPFKSIFGYYRGYFSVVPYTEGVRDYINKQRRTLYEFEINLRNYEIDLIKRHIWELLHVKPSYYFLQGNCASSINDIILINKERKGIFPPWIVPTDVVTDLYERGILKDKNEQKLFHKSQKVSLEYSIFNYEVILTYRPIYHDLLDKPEGFRRGYELIASEVSISYSRKKEVAFFDRWRMFKMSYLSDIKEGISWIFDIGLRRYTDSIYSLYSEGGLGLSLYMKDLTLFAMPYLSYMYREFIISAMQGVLFQNTYISFAIYLNLGKSLVYNRYVNLFRGGLDIHPHYRYSLRLEYDENLYEGIKNNEATVSFSFFF